MIELSDFKYITYIEKRNVLSKNILGAMNNDQIVIDRMIVRYMTRNPLIYMIFDKQYILMNQFVL